VLRHRHRRRGDDAVRRRAALPAPHPDPHHPLSMERPAPTGRERPPAPGRRPAATGRRLAREAGQRRPAWRTCRAGRHVLRDIWQALAMPVGSALAAVGGYGRRPALSRLRRRSADPGPRRTHAAQDSPPRARLEQLIGLLWDIGLDIGHSVRSIDQCLDEAERDITVKTALLEARLSGRLARRSTTTSNRAATPRWNRPPSSPPSNWNRPSAMPSSMTPPTAWNPTARKAPAAAATCRRSSGWRAPPASATTGNHWPAPD
jgi:hypothetical protein